MSEVIRVLIADEVPMVIEGIHALLEPSEGVAFVGEAHSAHEAFSLCQLYQPDVLLLSLDLPDLSALDVDRLIIIQAMGENGTSSRAISLIPIYPIRTLQVATGV